jgi:hypothetical protein
MPVLKLKKAVDIVRADAPGPPRALLDDILWPAPHDGPRSRRLGPSQSRKANPDVHIASGCGYHDGHSADPDGRGHW